MRAAERADEIGHQDFLPKALGHGVEIGELDGLGRRRRARIVDQNIEPAEFFDRAFHHALGFARRGDVAGRGDDVTARADQPLDLGGPAGILGEVIHRHRGSALREQLDRGEANARGAAGDEDGAAFEVGGDHDFLPFSFFRALPCCHGPRMPAM